MEKNKKYYFKIIESYFPKNKKQNENYCHYSGLPSVRAY